MTSKAEKRVQEYLASGKQLPPSIQEPHTPKNKNGTTNWNAIWDELITLNLAVDEQPAEKKDHSTRVCFLETNGEIYHQTTQGFINQHGEVKTEIHHEGKTYKPIEGEEITKGIVKLADQPEPYGTFKQLLQDSQDLIKEFVDVPDDFIKITALYTALTWVQDRFRTIPYWRVKGDYGTGKSRAWEVAYNLCCNPIPVQGALIKKELLSSYVAKVKADALRDSGFGNNTAMEIGIDYLIQFYRVEKAKDLLVDALVDLEQGLPHLEDKHRARFACLRKALSSMHPELGVKKELVWATLNEKQRMDEMEKVNGK